MLRTSTPARDLSELGVPCSGRRVACDLVTCHPSLACQAVALAQAGHFLS
jgi:hypothetical protein